MRIVALIFLGSFSFSLFSQNLAPEELLERSIAFHDPMNQWASLQMELVLRMETPNGKPRISKVNINKEEGTFEVSYVSKGHLLTYRVDQFDSAQVYADFQLATNRKTTDSLDLTSARARRWRDYYTYLYGLPMKIKDEGTILGEQVNNEYFNGQAVLALKVNYSPEVGKDSWYFYFHPETYALVGYRFHHDEAINDGEYIVLDEMEIQRGMRIPKNRYWYVNEDGRFLGADMMLSLRVN